MENNTTGIMLLLLKKGKINNRNPKNADLNVRERKQIPVSIFCRFIIKEANFHELKEKYKQRKCVSFKRLQLADLVNKLKYHGRVCW